MPLSSPHGKAHTEARILTAAAGLFARSGYAGVSTRDIAVAAGVNEITIYRHYPHKRDLYLATLDSVMREIALSGEPFAKIAEAQDVGSALAHTFEVISAGLADKPELLRLVQFSALELDSGIEQILRRHLGAYLEIIARHLQPWIDNGQLRCSSAKCLALALVSIVISYRALHNVFACSVPTLDVMFGACINPSLSQLVNEYER